MTKDHPDIHATLMKGVQAHQAAQFDEARAAYQLILDNSPDHADANHLLGVIAHQLGEHSKAVQFIDRAIKTNDTAAPFHNNMGNAQRALGNLENAADSYSQALTIQPDDTGTLSNLGLALTELGRSEEAIDCYRKALQIDPNILETNMRLGILLDKQGHVDDAIKYFKQAIIIKPDDADIYNFLAIALYKKKQFSEAEASIKMAISINPNEANHHSYLSTIQLEMKNPEGANKSCHMALSLNNQDILAHNNLGVSLVEMDRKEEAENSFRNALNIDPDYIESLSNLGELLLELNNHEEAIDCFRKAIKIDPDSAVYHHNLAYNLELKDNLDDAVNANHRALELDPEHRDAKVNLSISLLRLGQLKEGWEYYENRRSRDKKASLFPQPQWDGSTLVGKRIILWGDQGLGDEVRYASIIPDLQKTGANITIECDKRLTNIFTRSFANATILPAPHGGAAKEPEQFDYQCPLPGLARFFRNDYKSFANDGSGYLKADPALITFWKKRLQDISNRPKVGLSWNSPVTLPDRIPCYASIEELAPILNISGIDFVNLQSFESKENITEAKERFGTEIHTWDDLDNRNDLNGVAALTSCLDLVISFPTFSSELAGSLGVPTICFVSHKDSFDELGSKDNIWYPNTHHVSKNRNEPWQPVLKEISEITQSKFGL